MLSKSLQQVESQTFELNDEIGRYASEIREDSELRKSFMAKLSKYNKNCGDEFFENYQSALTEVKKNIHDVNLPKIIVKFINIFNDVLGNLSDFVTSIKTSFNCSFGACNLTNV